MQRYGFFTIFVMNHQNIALRFHPVLSFLQPLELHSWQYCFSIPLILNSSEGNLKQNYLFLSCNIRLLHYFFASAVRSQFRGVPNQCFGACSERTAAKDNVCIHHPRLRYAHLGLPRYRLFETMMLQAVSLRGAQPGVRCEVRAPQPQG